MRDAYKEMGWTLEAWNKNASLDNPGEGMATFTIDENSEIFIDPEIREIVKILNKNGFETNFSCQGGVGHSFKEARIGLFSDLKDDQILLIKMQELQYFLKSTNFPANYKLSLTYFNSGNDKFLTLEFNQKYYNEQLKSWEKLNV